MKPALLIRFIFERRGSLDEGDDDFSVSASENYKIYVALIFKGE